LLASSTLEPVINMSGVILHTGLGRARLATAAAQRAQEIAGAHATLEFDLDDGRRGDRQEHVRSLLCELTGAEDAFVVNNAAAALLICLRALAEGKPALLSRGEMVEIGGSFRVPDIVRESGCVLTEIGTTNRTNIEDYRRSLVDGGVILRCHTSNYQVVGFTSAPSMSDLASLATEWGVPFIHDQGTGCIVDTATFGIDHLPTIADSVASGAHVTICSGDKLLGGPQAGIIVGNSSLLQKARAHPMARAVRIDKMTLAALESTLRLYVSGSEMDIPTLRYMAIGSDQLRSRCERLADSCRCVVEEGTTELGGGSAPGTGLPTWRIGIDSESPDSLARELRAGRPHILGRIERDRVWLDPRTVDEDEMEAVECRLRTI
jgi:L-seryl-tRNA(Ser) seleniumtransferase